MSNILDLLLDRLNALTVRKPIRLERSPRVTIADHQWLPSCDSYPGTESRLISCAKCKYYAGAGAESALKCAVNPKGEASTCPDYELK